VSLKLKNFFQSCAYFFDRFYFWLGGIVASVAYVWGLGGIQIPKIGDEVLYLQIARVTSESGSWLPLRYEGGVLSTKPPFLYWLGMFFSNKAENYNLWAMRLPVVLVTLMGAVLVYFLSLHLNDQKILDRKKNAFWAAGAYLAFLSTYQHGRPFLVNSFEVLFLLVPLVFYFYKPQFTKSFWFVCVLCWGAVAWVKSFALIGVGAFSIFAAVWVLDSHLRESRKKLLMAFGFFSSAVFVALLIFSLWFVFDPDPKLLFDQFVIGENAVKFKGYQNYLSGLFVGIYPLYRIWLGPFANAGLLAFLLLGLSFYFFKKIFPIFKKSKIDHLAESQKKTLALLAFVGAFLIFYSLPTQRQENYLLPAMAVLAVLLAVYRSRIPRFFWKISIAFTLLVFAVLTATPFLFSFWSQWPILARVLWFLSVFLFFLIFKTQKQLEVYPILVFLCYIQLSNFSIPFNQSFQFTKAHQGIELWVPSHKLAQEERFRFLAPYSKPKAYNSPEKLSELCQRLPRGSYLVLEEGMESFCSRKALVLEVLPDLRSRQKFSEMIQILLGKTQYLMRTLKLLRLE
jgi:4-amino-4-deoxy-L-arabinose transferase-like glycosyltransferase